MTFSFGLYFGNTNLCLALQKDGKSKVIANDSGDRLTPAILAMNETEFVTGLAAKSGLTRNNTGSVTNTKRLLNYGINADELEKILNETSTLNKNNEKLFYTLSTQNRTANISLEEVVTLFFKRMFTMASNAVRNEPGLKLVLAVPVHFSKITRQKMSKLANDVGFNVVQLISEPTASLLAHGIGISSEEPSQNVLVYRLGGTSCDCTVLNVTKGLYSIVHTVHNSNLGGNFFTKLLADYIAGEFYYKYKNDPQQSKRSMSKLTQHAENCKHILSTLSECNVFIESLCDGVDWRQNITRPRFENLIAGHLNKYIEPINECLAESNNIKINKVILCGGSTKIPKLQNTISSLLSDADEFLFDRPDEIIAEGCAIQASYLSENWDPDCENLNMDIPVLKSSIIICDNKKEVKARIEAETPIPCNVKLNEIKNLKSNDLLLNIYANEISDDSLIDTITLTKDKSMIQNDCFGVEGSITKDGFQFRLLKI